MTPVGSLAAALPPAPVVSAGWLGLYPARNFRVTDGTCADCGPIASARWYFERETIAVPNPGMPTAGFAHGISAFDDLRAWRASRAADAPPARIKADPHVVERKVFVEVDGVVMRDSEQPRPESAAGSPRVSVGSIVPPTPTTSAVTMPWSRPPRPRSRR